MTDVFTADELDETDTAGGFMAEVVITIGFDTVELD